MDHTNGIVHLLRGDSYIVPIIVNLGDKLHPQIYTLNDNDRIYFGLMEPNKAFENAVVKKTFSNMSDTDEDGNILLTLNPEDTLNLLVGKYYYMVKLKIVKDDGRTVVKTLIPPTQFFIDGNNPEKVECDIIITSTDSSDDIIYDEADIIFEGGELT